MYRTTDRLWATNRYVSENCSRSSSSRLRTWDWIETSRADTGSSAKMNRVEGDRPRDPDPLPLTAGELVRVPAGIVATQADDLEVVPDALVTYGPLAPPFSGVAWATDLPR